MILSDSRNICSLLWDVDENILYRSTAKAFRYQYGPEVSILLLGAWEHSVIIFQQTFRQGNQFIVNILSSKYLVSHYTKLFPWCPLHLFSFFVCSPLWKSWLLNLFASFQGSNKALLTIQPATELCYCEPLSRHASVLTFYSQRLEGPLQAHCNTGRTEFRRYLHF